jgi:Uma2 family endonuclease
MTTMTQNWPLQAVLAGFRRFSVAEYHQLTEIGVLTENDNLELIEGYLVHKMARNPPHDSTLHRVMKHLLRSLPTGWDLRVQSAITLSDSEPEPDLAIVHARADDYRTRHPSPNEIELVVEVSDSTLDCDRTDKTRIYARAGIALYWIVNIPQQLIEVYQQPSGPTSSPAFAQRQLFCLGDSVSITIGNSLLSFSVQELLG